MSKPFNHDFDDELDKSFEEEIAEDLIDSFKKIKDEDDYFYSDNIDELNFNED